MTAVLERPWSSTSVDAYDLCPKQWDLRYGPNQLPRGDGTGEPDGYSTDVYRRRGRVVHRGVSTALYAAKQELAGRGGAPLDGQSLYRYWTDVRKEVGKAWTDEKMPSDPAEAQLCIDLTERTLRAVPVPRPGAIHGIEHKYTLALPSGIEIVFIPDWTWWVDRAAGVLRMVDWKSGKIEPDEVRRHQQLHRYAHWMRLLDPRVKHVEIELFAMRDGVGHVHLVDPAKAAKAAARAERVAERARAADEHPAQPGPRCTGCYFRKVCPAFNPLSVA